MTWRDELDRVLGTLRRYCGKLLLQFHLPCGEQEIDDLLQEAARRVLKARTEPDDLRRYLIRALRSAAVDAMRKQQHRPRNLSAEGGEDGRSPEAEDPQAGRDQAQVADRELIQSGLALLARERPDDAELLRWTLAGGTTDELATRLALRRNTVEQRVSRARRALARIVRRLAGEDQ
jgi:RNA polymerase sigma factor (sigma-70 family)